MTGVLVAGYVVMRVAMIAQSLRVASGSRTPPRRPRLLVVVGARGSWIVLAVAQRSALGFFLCAALLLCSRPPARDRQRRSSRTSSNPLHIAERYGLLAIIALGEGLFAAVAAVSALIDQQGWSTTP